ncbi:hypothetical protein BKI52_03315 [marine bacterium AO1-C]|nr:hypothetical protein BKI52_03315 [marine bacterium AO1-C]
MCTKNSVTSQSTKQLTRLFTLVLIATCLVAPRSSFAQDGPKNVIKTNILSPIVGSYNFFYERAIAKNSSLQLGGGFTNIDVAGTKINGFRVTPEFRYYPAKSKDAPKGFFVGPFINYQSLNLTVGASALNASAEGKATLTTFGGGLALGWQWLFGNVVALDLFFGPSLNSGSVSVDATATADGFTESDFSTGSFSGFGFRFGLSLGVAF